MKERKTEEDALRNMLKPYSGVLYVFSMSCKMSRARTGTIASYLVGSYLLSR